MEKNKKFLADISKIKDAIETKKLVVFAGAGISIDAGVPSWSQLIAEISSEIDVPKTEQDYLKIAQMYYNQRQQKEYGEKIRKVLQHKKVKYNEIHESIFQLEPEHFLTTNYDDFLEEMFLLKKELNAIGNNFNQSVHKLHTLDHDPQIKAWAILNEASKKLFMKKVDEIVERMNQIYEQWSQK